MLNRPPSIIRVVSAFGPLFSRRVFRSVEVLQVQRQQGVNLALGRQTMAQFLDRWLSDVVASRARVTTHRTYANVIRLRIAPFIGQIQLTRLTAQHVQNMLRALDLSGLSPVTVQRTRDVLRNALNQAVKWDLVPRNVAMLVDPPKVEPRQIRVLSSSEAQRFLAAVQGDRLEALYRVALALGLRQGEALGLRWQDIDLDAGTLRVVMSAVRPGGGGKVIMARPKTAKSQRTLPLAPSLITALRQHRVGQAEERLLAGSRWQDHGLVFPSKVGTPLHATNVVHAFHALLEEAGLPRLRFHDLRHSCAPLLAAQGVPARVAMEILGHSNIQTTLNLYTHVLDESKRHAVTLLDALLDQSEKAS